jgi:hypothetical protein
MTTSPEASAVPRWWGPLVASGSKGPKDRGCRGQPIQCRPPRLAAFSCREYPELSLETAFAAKPAEHLTIRLAPLAG